MGFFSDLFGSATGEGSGNVQSAFSNDQNEADAAQNNGAALQQQFGNQYGNENAQATNYGNQAATEYSNLAANPGFSASDTAAIEGNPNAAFNYYNPSQLEGDTSAYQGGLTGASQAGAQELQAAPDNETNWQGGVNSALQASGNQAVSGYGENLGAAVGTEGQSLNQAVGNEGQQLGQAVSGEGQGLGAAVDNYGGNLNSAVNPASLTVTPQQQQAIRDAAAQATSGQYQKMSEQAAQTANAQGNTSPAALAAIQENLGQAGAVAAGNAATTAQIQADQTALSANQNLAGLQSQNATNLYGAQSGASEALAGTQTNAAEAQGNAEQSAAGTLGAAQTGAAGNYYGAQSGTAQNLASTETGANENIAANQLNASGQEANLGYNAAQQGGAQQIATDTGLQSTGQTLATNADNAASARATTVANQTQTGENNLRNYYTGEQSTALNAGATAGQQQLGAYGTQTSGVNAANSNAGNVASSANTASGGGGATGLIGAGLSALTSLADGGTFSGYGGDSDDFGSDGSGGDTDYSVPPTPSATPTTPVQNSTVSKYRNAVHGLAGIVSPQFATPAQQPIAGAQQQQGATLGNNLNSIGSSIDTLASKLADGGTRGNGTPALIAEHGPEAVVTKFANGGTVQPSKYRPYADGGTAAAQPSQAGPYAPQSQAPTQAPQNPMRGDGSSVPGNQPGGAQGQQGWRGNAANQMAAGGAAGGAPPTQQYRNGQQQQTQVFTRPTNVNLGANGASDTVVPLHPGPNAKVLPSQMGMAAQSSPYRALQGQMPQQQPANQTQARMPSRYRPATGPKGLVGPQQPMQQAPVSNARQGQFAA